VEQADLSLPLIGSKLPDGCTAIHQSAHIGHFLLLLLLLLQVEEVPRVLKENSRSSFAEMLSAGMISAERKTQLDALRKEQIFIGRRDVITQNLDGTQRNMENEAELGEQLHGLGFAVVEAAEFSEEEKSYIFENAKVVVLPIGAG
jgi:capsular polysaccharide biosynthesis protein